MPKQSYKQNEMLREWHSWKPLIHRRIYSNLTDAEFIAWFAKKFPAVTEKQVAAVLNRYKAGESA